MLCDVGLGDNTASYIEFTKNAIASYSSEADYSILTIAGYLPSVRVPDLYSEKSLRIATYRTGTAIRKRQIQCIVPVLFHKSRPHRYRLLYMGRRLKHEWQRK